MGDPNFYSFRSVWELDAPATAVYAALSEIADYPKWWPEVKEVERIDDDHAAFRARAFLPYDLRFIGARAPGGEQERALEMTLTGDLEGFSRWRIEERGDSSRALFEEEVVANKKLLRRTARVARPLFKANHSLMMWRGRRGFETYLAGYLLGRAAL